MKNNTLKIITIASDKSEIKYVEKMLSDVFYENNLDKKYFNKVLLCISEAVINSIEHGNKNNRNKSVTIIIRFQKEKLCVEVKDEGEGFDKNIIEDPTISANLLKESGRGIHIIKSVADYLHFNDCGNCVQLEIKCQ